MHFVRSKREAPAGNRRGFFVLIALGLLAAAGQPLAQSPPRGTVLADLTWVEAERRLTPDTVVVIPLGAEAKEHGPHLRLDNDARLAAYFRDSSHPQTTGHPNHASGRHTLYASRKKRNNAF